MIPQHVLRETPYFQSIIQEGREEGREEAREIVVEMLLHTISLRFPALDVSTDIERVRNLGSLKQLFFELDQLQDEAALRQHLASLAPSTNG